MTPEERAAYVKGLRDGMKLAQLCAWISTHDGWSSHAPVIDWDVAEKKLAEKIAAAEVQSDG